MMSTEMAENITEMAEMNTENTDITTEMAENAPKVTENNQVAETDEEKLARLATEINTIKLQVQAVVQNATLEIGKRLIQAKAAVPHGCWGKWLAEKVEYSERTAQLLISTYKRFGDGQQKLFGPSVDPELVAQLNRSQIFTLMSIKNEDECIAFMEEHKEDLPGMSKRELEQAIKERDQAKADIEAWRSRCNDLTDTAEKAAQRAEKLKAELAKLKADTAAGGEEVEKLKAENENLQKSLDLEKQNASNSYDDAVEAQRQLAEERAKYEEQIKALKEAKDNAESEEMKRLQIEMAVRAGRIKDLEREVEELRKMPYTKPAPEKSQEEKDFARHFENCKAEFTQLINTMGAINENQDKYREATRKLLEIMSKLIEKESEEA